MAHTKTQGGFKSPAGLTALTIVVAALLIPAVAWTRESVHLYAMDIDGAFLGIYLPSRLVGLLGLVLMFFQFLLAARLPFMERFFKRSNLLKTHRNVGKIAYLLVLLHGVGMLLFDLVSAGEIQLFTEKTVGLIALIILTVAVIAAWFFKPLKLSLKQWRTIHLLTYIAFPLVLWHALVLGSTVNAVAPVRWLFQLLFVGYLLLVVYRLGRFFRSRSAAT